MMAKFIQIISGLFLFSLSSSIAWADQSQLPDMMNNFQSSATSINAKLFAPALITASAALSLQWIATHWKEIFSGDITSMLMKSIGVISWFGFSIFLLNNASFFSGKFSDYLNFAGMLSGIGVAGFSPGNIINNGILIIGKTNDAFSAASGSSWWHIGDNMVAAIMLSFANIFTFLAFLMIALSVFVAQMEFWVMFSVAPLAFALIPLSAFRDQGMAPIKGLISLGLRLIILGVIVSVAKTMTTTLVSQLDGGLPSGTAMYEPIWYYLAGMAGCAMMALSAGKIASSIASGSASFSGTDAIKGGMQMATTAAVGAAAVTGGAAALTAAGSAASKGAIGAASGAGRAVGAFSGRNNLGVSPGGGGAPGGGAPIVGGPLPSSSSGGGQALHSKSGAPASGGDSTQPASATQEVGGGDGSPAVGGASGDTAGGSASAPSGSESSSGTSAPPGSSATPSSGMGASGKGSSAGIGASPNSGAAPGGEASVVGGPLPSNSGASAATSDSGMSASSKGPENAAAPSASGDASAAGIEGGNPNTDKSAGPPKEKSRLGELGSSTGKAFEHLSQDHQAVSIQINTRGD